MRLYLVVDGAPARFLSVSDNPTVGEIRDALKVSTIKWCFDDSTYAQAADSRCLSGLVADGLAASGTGPTSAIKVQTRGATKTAQPQQAASPYNSRDKLPATAPAQQKGPLNERNQRPASASIPASAPLTASTQGASNQRHTTADQSPGGKGSLTVKQQPSKTAAVVASVSGSTNVSSAGNAQPPLNKPTSKQPDSKMAGYAGDTGGAAGVSQPGLAQQTVTPADVCQQDALESLPQAKGAAAQAASKGQTSSSRFKPAAAAAGKPTAAGGGDSSGKLLQGGQASPSMVPLTSVHQTMPAKTSGIANDSKPSAAQPQKQQQTSDATKPAVMPGISNRQRLQESPGQTGLGSKAASTAGQSTGPQSTATVGVTAQQGCNKSIVTQHGSHFTNGHHGLPTLEHAVSASSTALALSLQAKQVPALPQTKLPASSSVSTAADKEMVVAVAGGTSQLSTAATLATAAGVVTRPSATAKLDPRTNAPSTAAGPAAAAATTVSQSTTAADTLVAAGVSSSNGPACRGCGKADLSGRIVTALGSRWHAGCWKCAACAGVLEGGYKTGTQDNLPYHPACYKEKFGKRCAACNKVDTDITVEGKPMHRKCFKCSACHAVIDGSYNTDKESQARYHPRCYEEQFGDRCSACNKLVTGKYTTIGGRNLHNECFKCTACQGVIGDKYRTDEEKQAHYHPACYKEQFGKRCAACNKVDTDITVECKPMHQKCFKCSACHAVIDGSYNTDKESKAHYHPHCYKEQFGARCSACNKLFSGKYTVVGGKNLHYECFTCTDCHLAIGDNKYQTHGDDKLPYHLACHRKNFDPRCDVCSELVPENANGHVEYLVSSFWKQNYCKTHSSDGTPRCCSCNRLKPEKQPWVALSVGRRFLCPHCSCTAVRSTSEAQPLYDNVLGFFGRMGLALRERPPVMLVDGDTLDQERKPCKQADKQAPIFHILGKCLLRGHGHVNHVVHSQPGISSLYKQPSLNATLRPADLSQVAWEAKAILVMYGLPWLLTGAILAHEVMHAWVAENNVNCGHADGDEKSAVGEGLAELLGFMWLEAQVSPVAAVAAQGSGGVPLPKAKVVEARTWAQRVAADGGKYFFDPVTRQTTWNDPNRWQEAVAPDGCKVFFDQGVTTAIASASKTRAMPSVPVAVLKDLMADWKGHVGADGKTFYHNSTSKESVWVLPDNVRQQVTWFERLSSYYGNQTRTNTDTVYGDGFRAALEAYQQYGLRNVLLHVKKTNFLPSTDSVVHGSKDDIKNALRPKK